ncbi:g10071 [Coccomyxa elongata]
MNKFNRPRGNAVKQKKIKQRNVKKRSHVKEKADQLKLRVSGQRTGKSEKRRLKAQAKSLRKAVALGEVDLEMADLIPEGRESNCAGSMEQ